MKKIIILTLALAYNGMTHALTDVANEPIEIPILSDRIDAKITTTQSSANTKSWVLGIYPRGKKLGGYIGGTSESSSTSIPQGKAFIGIGISIQF